MIKFSAPAKIHFLGEHSVVYGKPAILAAINLRLTVTIIPSGDLPGFLKPVEKILKTKFKIPSHGVKIDSQIPIGAGLGSSAAISAAYIAAVLTYAKIKWDPKLINELAYEAEKVFHGNPSGGDNTTVVYGGFIWFEKGKPLTPLPFKIHKNIKPFILIDSGKPFETTKQMVDKVSSKFKVQSSKFKKIFDDQERLVKNLALALKNGDEEKLMQVVRSGERNLEKIGVVGKKAKSIISQVEKSGGAAKILGGGGVKGGSGMILCYGSNLKGIKIKIGEEGLRQENTSAP